MRTPESVYVHTHMHTNECINILYVRKGTVKPAYTFYTCKVLQLLQLLQLFTADVCTNL